MNPTDAPTAPVHTFNGLGIAPRLLSVLESLGFQTPTPIQHQAIPPAIEGKDVIGVAQTGTGKTLAFGLPVLQHIMAFKGRVLVVLPTRELALQVDETLMKVGKSLGLRTAVLIGGMSMGPQIGALKRDPHVIVATPGRLLDHMEQKLVSLNRISILVLDEADRMLDMGFWPQVRRIITAVPKERQTMLFSATLSKEIMELITGHMKLPVRIEVAPSGTTAERVTQEFFIVRKEEKIRLLEKVLGDYAGATLVFSRTKHGAKKIMRGVRAMGHSAAEIHGNRSLNQRKEALEGFKTGRYRVLVSTDIASRGIDVKGIELVINFDLPTESADYVHRIGRTARAGAEGHAISFAEPAQKREMREIERLIRKAVPVSALPELPPARALPHVSSDDRYERRGRPFHSPSHKRSSSSFGGGARPFRRSGGGGSRPHHGGGHSRGHSKRV